jgi:hypothetical protein
MMFLTSFWTWHSITSHLRNQINAQVTKVKHTLEQATKAQRWIMGIAPLFPWPRRCMGVGGQRHAPAALPPVKDPVPII